MTDNCTVKFEPTEELRLKIEKAGEKLLELEDGLMEQLDENRPFS